MLSWVMGAFTLKPYQRGHRMDWSGGYGLGSSASFLVYPRLSQIIAVFDKELCCSSDLTDLSRYTFDSRRMGDHPETELCRITPQGGKSCIKVSPALISRYDSAAVRSEADGNNSYSSKVQLCSRACNRSVSQSFLLLNLKRFINLY